MKTFNLLSPGSLLGFASARHPAALPPDHAALITNMRLTTGVPQAREADLSINTNIAAGVTRGAFACVLDGVLSLFVAVSNGTNITVWKSVDEGITWTNITPSSGAYGDTRFIGQGNPIAFTVVRDRPRIGLTAYDLLVIQNGVVQARIYGKATADSTAIGSGVSGCSVCAQPPIPARDGNLVAFTAFSKFFAIGNAGSIVCSSTDSTKFKVISSGVSASTNFVQIQVTSTWLAGRTGTVAASSGSIDLSKAKSLVTVADTDTVTFWDNIGLTITDNGPANDGVSKRSVTLYDPAQQIGSKTSIPLSGTQTLAITNATNATPIVITTAAAHGLADGSQAPIAGVSGNLAANGSLFAKVTGYSATTFGLYYDQALTRAVAGTGVYSQGGLLTQSSTPGGLLNLTQYAYPMQLGQAFDYAHVTAVTFYWTASVPAASINANLYMLAGSGQFQGTSVFGVTYAGSDMRQEGPIQYLSANTQGSVSRSGGPVPQVVGGPDMGVADDARIYYDYQVYVSTPPTASVNLGVDRANLYARLPGQTQYFLTASTKTATFGGGAWTANAGGYALFAVSDYLWSALNPIQSLGVRDPGSDALSLPASSTMAMANGRLFVGQGSRVYYSDYEFPFRFRNSVRFFDAQNADPLSGGSFSMDGDTIQAIIATGTIAGDSGAYAPIEGIATIYFLTGAGFFRVSGVDAMSINRAMPVAPYGTNSPSSVTRSVHGFYWRDQRGQIRYWDGSQFLSPYMAPRVPGISVDIVDDRTAAVPAARAAWAWGCYVRERYFLAYTRAGQGNNDRCLVWSERHQTWESEDTAANFFQALVQFYSPTTGRIRMVSFYEGGGNVGCFEYEQPGNTANVAIAITFREISAQEAMETDSVTTRRMSGSMDLNSGAVSIAGTVTYPQSALSASLVISTTGSTEVRGWLISPQPATTQIDRSFQPAITATVPGLSKFYILGIEVDARSQGPSAT